MHWYVCQFAGILQNVSFLHKYPGMATINLSRYEAERWDLKYISGFADPILPVHKVVALNTGERSCKVEVISLGAVEHEMHERN